MSPENHQALHRYQETRKVTLVGAVVNIVLTLAQLTGGIYAQSQALIADALHTLSDLGSDAIVLIASRQAHKQADTGHPYGHGRIETLATSLLGAILIAVGAGIGIDSIDRLMNPERLLQPHPVALFFAALAVFCKEGLYHYTVHIAKKVNSSLLRANAWHHRSDAISSVMVIIGVALSLAGLPQFDAIAAMAVAAMIAYMGWKLLWQSSQELIDASLDEETVATIRKTILSIDGVVSLHQLRTRQSGSDAFADVHVQVPSYISVSEGHQIAETVRRAVTRAVDSITDVVVHTDPEDDAIAAPCKHLPLRAELLAELQQRWQGIALAEEIERITLHYLDGQFEIWLYLKAGAENTLEAEESALRSVVSTHPLVRAVALYRSA